MKISVFSTGTSERNEELVPQIITRAFPDPQGRPTIRVFSRKDTIDTERLRQRGEHEKTRERLQGYWYGQLKKKLADVVVTQDELPSTLLIDDDSSYSVGGEERNLIKVCYLSYRYLPNDIERGCSREEFIAIHKAYYICGIIQKIQRLAKQEGLELVEAAKCVQVEEDREAAQWDKGRDGSKSKFGREFHFCGATQTTHLEPGLGTLERIDPSLRFYVDWPKEQRER